MLQSWIKANFNYWQFWNLGNFYKVFKKRYKRFTNVFKGNKIEEWDGTKWNYAQDSLVKDFNSGRSVELLCPAGN